jgi:hypothetical protein
MIDGKIVVMKQEDGKNFVEQESAIVSIREILAMPNEEIKNNVYKNKSTSRVFPSELSIKNDKN